MYISSDHGTAGRMGRPSFPRFRVPEPIARLVSGVHLRHRWRPVERIGHVVTQRCATCDRTRVRVR
ncbi:hypothetical protein [Sphaerisporangium corydalis]|uniref:Uncharacterized protein n=1 Tax=Sphaerisporangium corydalis TaxID=1441875 RepID=A0ABV9E7W2_9ACTN|nr:hypothetical protein [Sphaerisporangium corydalis]